MSDEVNSKIDKLASILEAMEKKNQSKFKFPTWLIAVIFNVACLGGLFIYFENKNGNSETQKPDDVASKLGFEAGKSYKLVPYNAILKALDDDFSTTGEVAEKIHANQNAILDSIWSDWADEMKNRFGETSTKSLTQKERERLVSFLRDFANGIKDGVNENE